MYRVFWDRALFRVTKALPGVASSRSLTMLLKSALNSFTVHLAAALKDTNIKVNSAHPGWVKTDLGGKNAPLEAPEGAKTSVSLASADFTGKFIHEGEEGGQLTPRLYQYFGGQTPPAY